MSKALGTYLRLPLLLIFAVGVNCGGSRCQSRDGQVRVHLHNKNNEMYARHGSIDSLMRSRPSPSVYSRSYMRTSFQRDLPRSKVQRADLAKTKMAMDTKITAALEKLGRPVCCDARGIDERSRRWSTSSLLLSLFWQQRPTHPSCAFVPLENGYLSLGTIADTKSG
ncbi:hypothetical protein AAFF_G00203060 [Aldrovandia affinis]|uniref:Uncharacterized protein n=1 Tax=Aldrovandia affinis TaxID=143900 RepID=A0AAD7WVB4_9TELE|nr:hypothetical protein AAFF_G00203060 [Aldrovandia affinis]